MQKADFGASRRARGREGATQQASAAIYKRAWVTSRGPASSSRNCTGAKLAVIEKSDVKDALF
jgi:hypothetical protein